MSKRKNKHVKLLRDPEPSIEPHWTLAKLQNHWEEWDPAILRDIRFGLACAALQGYLSMHADPNIAFPVPTDLAGSVVDYADATLLELVNRKYH